MARKGRNVQWVGGEKDSVEAEASYLACFPAGQAKGLNVAVWKRVADGHNDLHWQTEKRPHSTDELSWFRI
jgi:hypothetical protein